MKNFIYAPLFLIFLSFFAYTNDAVLLDNNTYEYEDSEPETLIEAPQTSRTPTESSKSKVTSFKNGSIKIAPSVPRLGLVEFEYQLSNPGFSAFLNYGSGQATINEGDTKVAGYALGIRYYIPYGFYLGLGYGSLDIEYSYVQKIQSGDISIGANVVANGQFPGPFIELGNSLFFDNFVLGGSIGAIVGKLKNLTATVEGTAVDPNDVNEGVATLDFIPQVTLFIGLRF